MPCLGRSPLTPLRLGWWTLLSVGAAAGPAIALKWLPWPYCFIALFWSALSVRLVFACRRRNVKAFWFNVAVIVAAVGCCEAFYALSDSFSQPKDRVDYEPGYHINHSSLGYAPKRLNRSRAVRHHGDELVYDVHYTIDGQGLRVGPPAEPSSAPLLFFGGSYTYGEGLDDHETMPYRVGLSTHGRYRIYNFSFHGYGPHQMLAAISDGLVAEIVEGAPGHAIYQALLPPHARRLAGKARFGRAGPRYVLAENGSVERRGRLRDAPRKPSLVERQLSKSHLYTALHPDDGVGPKDFDLFIATVRTARNELVRLYPEIEFHVIVWGPIGADDLSEVTAAMERDGIIVHSMRAIAPDYQQRPDLYWLHKHDSHPSRFANELVAKYVIANILR